MPCFVGGMHTAPSRLRSPLRLSLVTACVTAMTGLSACGTPDAEPEDKEPEDPAARKPVDYAYTRVLWDEDEGPEAREHAAFFISDDGGTFFLLSGGGYPNVPTQELLDDAWRFDVATSTWSPWAVSGDVPPPAGSRRVARLPGNRAVLFGGYTDDFVSLDELFLVDLDTGVFTALAQTSPRPAVRSLHAFDYDPGSDRLVTFGGFFSDGNSQDILGDTWLGELSEETATVLWERLDGPGPGARYGMFSGVDDGHFVVFSGAGFPTANDPVNALDDLWSLDVADRTWRELSPSGDTAPGRRNGCGVLDPSTHTLYVFGGTADGRITERGTWLLDVADEAWTLVEPDDAPAVRSSGFGAPLPGGGFVCGFGNDFGTFRDLFFFK